MITDRLKEIIFKKLYKDLSKVEIIPYLDNIWFIDRENKYWYLEYKKSGILYWRYPFFNPFFELFSLERGEYEPLISLWVEEVLNYKVDTTRTLTGFGFNEVEDVLNCKVDTTSAIAHKNSFLVEDVLNCKVKTTSGSVAIAEEHVEGALNCKVNVSSNMEFGRDIKTKEVLIKSTSDSSSSFLWRVGDVLNYKVGTPKCNPSDESFWVEKVLNCKVNKPLSDIGVEGFEVEEVLNYKVDTSVAENNNFVGPVDMILKYKVNELKFANDVPSSRAEEVLELTKNDL